MQLIHEVPDSFWTLFRSVNRTTYIDAVLKISEEYQYNNYYLSWDVCVQILSNHFVARRIAIEREDQENELDILEPPATRVLRFLVRSGWLKQLEDFAKGVTNLVIPDYAAVMIEAFEKLNSEQGEDTEIFIQNVYAILFSYRNDSRRDHRLLHTALVNTRELNRVLQNMLHNMDKFFASLLNQEFYGDLLKEHLDGYVEEVVRKKYHILKTTDNFYQYKMDIKNWLKEILDEENRNLLLPETDGEGDRQRERSREIVEKVLEIERGFRDIERRIFNMDKEHTRYVRATVTKLNYLLNEDQDMRGLLVKLLQVIADSEDNEELSGRLKITGGHLNFSRFAVFSDQSLYRRRKARTAFADTLSEELSEEELSRDSVLKLNRIQARYSRRQIEQFIESRMTEGRYQVDRGTVECQEDFEKLILAYDQSIRRDSKFTVLEDEEQEMSITSGIYRYPSLTFVSRRQSGQEEQKS